MAAAHQISRALLLAVMVLARQALAVTTCTDTTRNCDDSCNEVGTCQAGGVWVRRQNCQAAGQVCRSGACIALKDTPIQYCNDLYLAECPVGVTTPVLVPSLVDCTSYYVCDQTVGEAFPTQCPGRAFDACTGRCDGALVNGECRNQSVNRIECSSTQQSGIAANNDRLHYTCVYNNDNRRWVPKWSQCSDGFRYSTVTRNCEHVGALPGQCLVCGGASRVPGANPSAVSRCDYVWCNTRDSFEVRSCRAGYYYDHAQGTCEYGGGAIVC